ncbi:energy transducer TonB [Saccharicrinis sp. FJH54]|uniref:energy transducer TonB n=1 Tax=Saccharicrinis sp. FJH54 TaxID=3344665 RepID=UPI0035D4CB6D
MRLRFILIYTFLVFSFSGTYGADRIIYNGTTYNLYNYPLQFISKFKQWNTKPIFGEDAKIQRMFDQVPYYCTWIVQDDHIYLQSIKSDSLNANLLELFPDKYDNGLVLADWIDTILYAPYGEMILSWDITFSGKIYEYELAFKVLKGEIISVEKCDNTMTKTKLLKDERLLRELIKKNTHWENLPESDTIDRRVYVQVASTDNQGKIDSVKILKGVNDIYDREAVRIVKTIPEWPVIYNHGELSDWWIFPIVFDMSDKNKK